MQKGPKKFFIRGLLEDKGPASSFDGQVAVMALDAAQIMFGRGFAVDRIDIVVQREKGRKYAEDEQKAQAEYEKFVTGSNAVVAANQKEIAANTEAKAAAAEELVMRSSE